MFEITLPEFTNPLAVTWWLFTHGGFLIVLGAVAAGGWWIYLDSIRTAYAARQKYVMLAVDVPKENEQTPKAVEHMFAHLHGIHKNPDWKEQYIDGYVQPTITLELISIGGYIQYLIRCPIEARDLVEASIYAQYPNAEITEVEDYSLDVPKNFPNDEYDLWAADMVFVKKDCYPIRTYPQWEHQATQTFLDPMASLLEVMARIRDGEQIWLQWILEPLGTGELAEMGAAEINKLIGGKSKVKPSTLMTLAQAPVNFSTGLINTLGASLTTGDLISTGGAAKADAGTPNNLLYTPPNVRTVVDNIGYKIAKIPFRVKFRVVYTARKSVFTKARVSGVMGAIKQFNTMDMNGFKPSKTVKTARNLFFVQQRVNALKRRLLLAYQYRNLYTGDKLMLLNTEELASLWHFPVMTVKAPLVNKTAAKRGEPPVSLPVGQEVEYVPKARPEQPAPEAAASEPESGSAPENLPFA